MVNAESLEGVCVRHNDVCTPVCVPRGEGEPWRRRVCSKGSVHRRPVCFRRPLIVTHFRVRRRCHLMAKVDKADNSVSMGTAEGDCKAEADKFLLVVCQVEGA